jgi:hypothetical protein
MVEFTSRAEDSEEIRLVSKRRGGKTMYFRSATTYCLFGLLQSAICLLDAHAAAPQAEWISPHVPQGAIMTSEGKEIFQVEFSCRSPQPSASVTIYGGDKYHGSVLKRVETDLPFILEVQRAFGGSAKFPVILYYSPADGGTWNSGKEGGLLTPAFFDAFAHDGRLICEQAAGRKLPLGL